MSERTIVVSISETIAKKLEALSARTGMTKSMIIEEALSKNIDNGPASSTLSLPEQDSKAMKILLDVTARSLLLLQKEISLEEQNDVANQARALIKSAL